MKKFLSLVLALVMTMSLVTISAGAKDFTDDSKITYEEAVDVVSAVKVVDGYADGSFNPTATLTRGAAAKIICNLILGPTTAGALSADAAPYKDVPANSTFAGYIAYCAKEGIISGYADGTFRPGNSLTGYAFMKMLLGALGYDADVEGYTGANWSINVAKRALNIKLDKGLVDDFDGVKPVTREEACLYAFNTLKATMVDYDSKTNISVGDAEVVITGSKAQDVGNTAAASKQYDGKADGKMQFCEKFFDNLKKSSTTDAFERPATKWSLKSKEIGTYADEADESYTEAVKLGTIYADLGLSKSINAANIKAYVDGATNATLTAALANGIVKGDTSKIGGNGVLTEVFYDSDDNSAKITQVNTYIGEIAATYPETSTKDAYVTLKAGATNTGTGTSFETDDTYAVGDKVLYTRSSKAGETQPVKSMAKAESVTGTLTAYTEKTSVTVDGTAYKANNVQKSKDTIGNSLSNAVKTDVTVYLDEYGYAIYVDAAAASDAYAVVLGYDKTTAGAGTMQTATEADLLFLDGTRKTVKVVGTFAGSQAPHSGTAISVYDIVSYRLNSDGKYVLTEVAAYYDADHSSQLISKGNTTMANTLCNINVDTSGIDAGKAANGKTVFLFWNGANKTVSRYVGIANAPSFKTKSGSTDADVTVYLPTGAAAAKIVFVSIGDGDIFNGENKDTLFIKGSGTSEQKYNSDLGNYWEYDAILNGEITTVQTSGKISSYTLADNFSTNTKGVITVTPNYFCDNSGSHDKSSNNKLVYAQAGTNTENDAVVNGTVTLAGKPISVADDLKVFTIDVNGDIAASTINAVQFDANDKVWYKLNADNEVEFIVLQVVDAITGAPAPDVNPEIEIINSDAGNNYKDSTFYIADGSALTPAEMQSALFAEMKDDGCTNITLKGKTITFTKNGNNYTVENCSWKQVYAVTFSTEKLTVAGVDFQILSADKGYALPNAAVTLTIAAKGTATGAGTVTVGVAKKAGVTGTAAAAGTPTNGSVQADGTGSAVIIGLDTHAAATIKTDSGAVDAQLTVTITIDNTAPADSVVTLAE